MKKYLNINNPIMRGLSRVADCLFLSVLWLVFSLPVITIGASSTALYTTVNSLRSTKTSLLKSICCLSWIAKSLVNFAMLY